ncbi:MAG: glycosyltransferase family 2 protein [bacterium]
MKCLVVIPAFNEAENIVSVIEGIRRQDPSLGILVVDDGSGDETAQRAAAAGAEVLSLPYNLGYGGAVQTGMLFAYEKGYDLCVLIDGDGQHDPKYIPDLMGPVAEGRADLSLGSRFLGRADYSIPWARRVGMFLFSKITSWITGQHITDPTSGFQAISRSLIKFFLNDNYPVDFPDADTLIRLYFAGFRILEIPVVIRPRERGVSMHGGSKALYYVYKMFFSIFIALTQRSALRKEGMHALDH